MRRVAIASAVAVSLCMALVMTSGSRVAAKDQGRITLLDDCDPADPAWGTNGCLREEGSVTRAEFNQLLASPLSAAVVGHPSWRISPSYRLVDVADTLEVANGGGRGHTFTEVAQFGGGFIPALNKGLAEAPECAQAQGSVIAPGGRVQVGALSAGNHRFQCCIHPWMRAIVKVAADPE